MALMMIANGSVNATISIYFDHGATVAMSDAHGSANLSVQDSF